MNAYLKLIRFPNLLMLALMQLTVRYGFLKWQDTPLALNDWQYALLVLATVCIAGGGYVINNIFDQQTDLFNKPETVVVGAKISETQAYNLYAALSISGAAIGFYLSNVINHPGFLLAFILSVATLYLYASSFKQHLLIGNFLVAALMAFSVIIIGLFDLYPLVTPENHLALGVYFDLLLDYALFCFMVSLLREIVKDLEDVNGDYNQGMKTLPIVLGVSRTVKVVFGASLIPIAALVYYVKTNYMDNHLYYAAAYTLATVVSPLVYFSIKTWSATSKKDFRDLSTVLKIVLLFGIFSIAAVTFNILNHA